MQSRIWVQLEHEPGDSAAVRWYLPDSADKELQSATLEDFRTWVITRQKTVSDPLKAVLLVAGDKVVSRSVTFAENEKKHLQKLLPFMLESQLAVDLPQVHVAYQLPQDSRVQADKPSVLVAYTDRKQLQWRIEELESLGLEVEDVFSIAAILPATETNWSLLPDGDICHLHAGSVLCASMEPEMISTLLDSAIAERSTNAQVPTLTVFVTQAEESVSAAKEYAQGAESLLQALSAHAGLSAAGIRLRPQQQANAWSHLHTGQAGAVNLRQGEFSAPLRLAKYWKQWRVPAMAAVFAVTAVLLTAVVETQINQYRFRALDARIEQRYREVMPEGVLVDAVQQLSAQVAQRRNAGASQSLISMLDAMLEPFGSVEGISLHRLSYNSNTQTAGTAAEIQMNISAPSATEILQFSENLTAAGWNAQAQNISRVGSSQQANLVVRGNSL